MAKSVMKFLLASNCVSAIAFGGLCIPFYQQLLIQGRKPTEWIVKSKTVATWLTSACAIISGAIMIKGLISIRQFFKDKGHLDSLRTSTMVKHGVVFGFYLLGDFAFTVAISIFDFKQDQRTFEWAVGLQTVNFWLQLIAEVILFDIFWHAAAQPLALKSEALASEDALEPTAEVFVTLTVTSADESFYF